MPRRRLEAGGRDGIAETRHQERHCVLVCCGKDVLLFQTAINCGPSHPALSRCRRSRQAWLRTCCRFPLCFAWNRDPVILPFFHSNMGSVLPVDSIVPRVGKEVTVTIGKPAKMPMLNVCCYLGCLSCAADRGVLLFRLPCCCCGAGQPLDLSDVTCRCNQPGQDQQQVSITRRWLCTVERQGLTLHAHEAAHKLSVCVSMTACSSCLQVWMDITLRMHDAMKALEGVCPPNPYQRENPKGKPGAEALKQVDPRLAGRA